MLINCSNHPHINWSAVQLKAAQDIYGEIQDYPFPSVDPLWSEAELAHKALEVCAELTRPQPDAVLCQGEMGMTCALVWALWGKGIPVLHACSERISHERKNDDGSVTKVSEFVFRGFRAYVHACRA